MEKESASSHKLNKHARGIMGALIVEYLLGMFSNLFIAFPEGAHEKQLWEFAWRQWPIALHIIIGILLLLGTITLFIRSIILKNRAWIIASAIGGISVLAAVGAGASFIPKQTDLYSFIMAVSFIVALLAYFWGI